MRQREIQGRERVVIENVHPQVEGGRFAASAAVGDSIELSAEVFADGHDHVAASAFYRAAGEEAFTEVAMTNRSGDRFVATVPARAVGVIEFTIEGWIDRYETWRSGTLRKAEAGQDVAVELVSGAALLEEAAARAVGHDAAELRGRARALGEPESGDPVRLAELLDAPVSALMRAHQPRRHKRQLGRVLEILVERERARFSAWYELFPRSTSPDPKRHGTFDDVIARLPYVAGMGFDVLYLPPVHPIGRTFRKGKNNALEAEPGDLGSPWAIGAAEGGHTAIHPELGSAADFERLVAAAREHGLEVAIDIAFQSSPDHPWVTEHPEWFKKRADGTIQYAENPPKKYQDVYPFDFENPDYKALWRALADVFRTWIGRGVEIFRVDNPHTKPFDFWEWLIAEIRAEAPGVIFLSEAFARPNVMYRLAKLGFSQSYNYFPWKNAKWEIEQYFSEITEPRVTAFLRPASWVNTPDILNEYLQVGGRPGSMIRLILAATLSANYGVYGPVFELLETRPREPGSEEYLDSEKYQQRTWDLDAPHSLKPLITRVNHIRRQHPALQRDHRLRFHHSSSENIVCYSKTTAALDDVILVACNVDPHHRHDGWVHLDLEALGLESDQTFQVHDLLSDARYLWHGADNYVALDPHQVPAHIFHVQRRTRTEHDFEYFL